MVPPPLAVLAYAFHEFAYAVGELITSAGSKPKFALGGCFAARGALISFSFGRLSNRN